MTFKITYSALNANMDTIHAQMDAAISRYQSRLGERFYGYAGSKKIESQNVLTKKNPANFNQILSQFAVTPITALDNVYSLAKKAQKSWAATPWEKRVEIVRKTAEIMRKYRMDVATTMIFEVGKNRMESLGDAEEAADLLDYYAQQMIDAQGFIRPLGKLSPNEKTLDTLRPYGVFSVIAPFNFPMALGAGMASAAILGGNSVVFKPSDDAPGCAEWIYRSFQEAGLPEGVLNIVYGDGPALGEAMVKHGWSDGVAFTGSRAVGLSILRTLSQCPFMKPVLAELGGKNPAFITPSADLDKAAMGCFKSAFGLTGQKCSALSKIYVHPSVKKAFLEKLISHASAMTIGDPADQKTFMGPIINQNAHARFMNAVSFSKSDGEILFGGRDLRTQTTYSNGWFIEPAIVEVKSEVRASSRWLRDEYFAPFVAITDFTDLSEAIAHANTADYGLTAGIFSEEPAEIEHFMNSIEAGILYANRATGATTGAWPGVQSFCGWKGSGLTGKGGCGPYYVAQFMREQSRTVME